MLSFGPAAELVCIGARHDGIDPFGLAGLLDALGGPAQRNGALPLNEVALPHSLGLLYAGLTAWLDSTGRPRVMLANLAGVELMSVPPGSVGKPVPGFHVQIIDSDINIMKPGEEGAVGIRLPLPPGCLPTLWKAPDQFKESYLKAYPGYYFTGDGCRRDKDGYYWITGRIDDVLNVSGHRMGTMEIESALVSCTELVAEAAVVGRPDETTGEAICAFVVLKRARPTGDEAKKIATELRNWVAKEIGPIAKPKDIRFGDNLPKTRSGKIMRRLLRSLAKGETITQDTSTLENPAILDQLTQTN